MAQTKIKQDQLKLSTNPGSLIVSDTSNVYQIKSPTTGADHLWFYDHSATDTVPLTIGTNLSITGTTLNASAGAGGYAEVQEEGSALTARTKINFVGSAFTATDDAGNTRTNVTAATFLNTLATAGTVTLTSDVTGKLPAANLLDLAGLSVLGRSGSTSGVMAAVTGTANQVLRVDSGATTLAFGAINIASSSAVTGILANANGGTGFATYAVGDLLYADTTSSLARRAAVASGSVLKSAGVSTAPVWGTLASTDLSDTANIALLSGTQTFSGTKTFTNNITINGTPSATTDAATVGYVQTYVQGLDPKGSVRAATTVAGTLASSFANGSVIDGITLATGDRILIKNQASAQDNGIYTVNASGAPTRATDMDSWAEVPSSFLFVELGTVNADTGWVCTSDQGGTLGTTAITFVRFASNVSNISGSGVANKVAYWSATDTLTSTTNFHFNGTQLAVGTATPATSAVVTVQGTGTGNTTYGIQHQNSSATQVFRVADDGTTVIGTGNVLTVTGNSLSSTGGSTLSITNASGQNIVINNGNGGTFQFGAGFTWAGTSGTLIAASTSSAFVPTSGTATFTNLAITPTVNQTGGANGISRGIHINPTLTAAADFRGLEITANSSHYALWTTAGKVRHDLGSDASYDTYYRGTGGELVRLANAGTTGFVLTATSGAAPTWAAPAGGTKTVGYVTGSGTTTYDLDAGVVVKDVDGAAFAFTVPTNLDLVDVYRNGQMLYRSGTVTRDYTLVSATGVLTFTTSVGTDEEIKLVKQV